MIQVTNLRCALCRRPAPCECRTCYCGQRYPKDKSCARCASVRWVGKGIHWAQTERPSLRVLKNGIHWMFQLSDDCGVTWQWGDAQCNTAIAAKTYGLAAHFKSLDEARSLSRATCVRDAAATGGDAAALQALLAILCDPDISDDDARRFAVEIVHRMVVKAEDKEVSHA
jgi:hypothetical protein